MHLCVIDYQLMWQHVWKALRLSNEKIAHCEHRGRLIEHFKKVNDQTNFIAENTTKRNLLYMLTIASHRNGNIGVFKPSFFS